MTAEAQELMTTEALERGIAAAQKKCGSIATQQELGNVTRLVGSAGTPDSGSDEMFRRDPRFWK